MPNKQLPIESLRDMTNGMIYEDVVGPYKAPKGSVNLAVNMDFDTIGEAKTRLGTTLLGDSQTGNVLGLHQFLDQGTGTNDQMIMVNGTDVRYLNSSSVWTSNRTVTTGKKARFTNMIDKVFMVNGTDLPKEWSGATGDSWDATNLSSAPTAYTIDTFRSRLWMGNTDSYPERVYYSPVVSSTRILGAWTSDGFVDCSDGEDITGIKSTFRSLLVFKPRHIYRIYSANEADPDPNYHVGTYCQESVVSHKDGVYFHDWVNGAIQRFTRASELIEEVSRPIKSFLDAVTLANRDDTAGWADSDHVYHSLGDLTVGGVTFTKVVSQYTISTRVWSLRSYPYQILVGASYDDGSTLEPVVGNTNGDILRFNKGNTDNGTPITYELITHWHDLSGVRSHIDVLKRYSALHRNFQGASLQYQVDFPEVANAWIPLGQLEKNVTVFHKPITGHRVRFRLSGVSSGEQAFYEGIEILESLTRGVLGE